MFLLVIFSFLVSSFWFALWQYPAAAPHTHLNSNGYFDLFSLCLLAYQTHPNYRLLRSQIAFGLRNCSSDQVGTTKSVLLGLHCQVGTTKSALPSRYQSSGLSLLLIHEVFLQSSLFADSIKSRSLESHLYLSYLQWSFEKERAHRCFYNALTRSFTGRIFEDFQRFSKVFFEFQRANAHLAPSNRYVGPGSPALQ